MAPRQPCWSASTSPSRTRPRAALHAEPQPTIWSLAGLWLCVTSDFGTGRRPPGICPNACTRTDAPACSAPVPYGQLGVTYRPTYSARTVGPVVTQGFSVRWWALKKCRHSLTELRAKSTASLDQRQRLADTRGGDDTGAEPFGPHSGGEPVIAVAIGDEDVR